MKIKAKVPPLYESEQLKPGVIAEDGSIYLGFYGDQDWYVAATDLKTADKTKNLCLTFNDAVAHIKNLTLHGHQDWMLAPCKERNRPDIAREMARHWEAGAFKGTYKEREWYWSGSLHKGQEVYAWYFNVKSNNRNSVYKNTLIMNLRPVRAVKR